MKHELWNPANSGLERPSAFKVAAPILTGRFWIPGTPWGVELDSQTHLEYYGNFSILMNQVIHEPTM